MAFIPDDEGRVWTMPDKHDVSVWDGLDLWSRSPGMSVGDVLGQGWLCSEAPIAR